MKTTIRELKRVLREALTPADAPGVLGDDQTSEEKFAETMRAIVDNELYDEVSKNFRAYRRMIDRFQSRRAADLAYELLSMIDELVSTTLDDDWPDMMTKIDQQLSLLEDEVGMRW
jgi:hypothetical protein